MKKLLSFLKRFHYLHISVRLPEEIERMVDRFWYKYGIHPRAIVLDALAAYIRADEALQRGDPVGVRDASGVFHPLPRDVQERLFRRSMPEKL